MAVTASVIRGDEDMSKYLSNPDLVLTAFPASDNVGTAVLAFPGWRADRAGPSNCMHYALRPGIVRYQGTCLEASEKEKGDVQ